MARGAATIEERAEDDDGEPSSSAVPRKETLMELLGSNAPGPSDENPSGRRGSTKRSVPAVVLGTPPPHEPTERFTASSSNGRPEARTESLDGDDSDLESRRVQPKSSAQELADFFKNAPPPPTAGGAPAPVKSKGFRSFMSMVTGKKKDEDRSTPTLASSASQTGLNTKLISKPMARRQKSLQNVASPPYFEDAPALPDRSLLRKNSDTRDIAAIPAVVIAASTVGEDLHDRKGPEDISMPHDRSTLPPTISTVTPDEALGNDGSRERDTGQSSPSPSHFDPALLSPAFLGRPINGAFLARPNDSQQSITTSDAGSFRTAEEGDDTLDDKSSIISTEAATEIGRAPVASISRERMTAGSSTDVGTTVPSIPLAELVPLRNLLQHATSVRECHMLLSAILTQWHVPLTPDSSGSEPSPETRVAAWLLAGREGPAVIDTPSSSAFSKVDDEEVVTPTQAQSARVASPSALPPFNTGVDEEELLTSETSSETSSTKGDLIEGLPPSFAKSAQRMSPVTLHRASLSPDLSGEVNVSTNGGV